jgi:hypothetical protein
MNESLIAGGMNIKKPGHERHGVLKCPVMAWDNAEYYFSNAIIVMRSYFRRLY